MLLKQLGKLERHLKKDQSIFFFMFAYLLDVVCACNYFLFMGWKSMLSCYPIHIYYIHLYNSRYHHFFYDICDKFMSPLNVMTFKQSIPRISKGGHQALQGIKDLYVEEHHTYIRIYGLNYFPHLLLMFVPSLLLLKEISYQTNIKGITTSLASSSKKA